MEEWIVVVLFVFVEVLVENVVWFGDGDVFEVFVLN